MHIDVMESVVVALGGNAILGRGVKPTYANQLKRIMESAKSIAIGIRRSRYGIIVITHGNGPQVGDEFLRNEYSRKVLPPLPLHMLTAETQATIGAMLQRCLLYEFSRLHIDRDVEVVITHALVNKNDTAFEKATKPIGPFYNRNELKNEMKSGAFDYVHEQGRYRRVVASPKPLKVLEIGAIKKLASSGAVVIAGGGGGIPVIKSRIGYAGVDAVIDKDYTSQVIASALDVDRLSILTEPEYVYMDFPKNKMPVKNVRLGRPMPEIKFMEEGTMKPKVEACMQFISNGGNKACIGNIKNMESANGGVFGTVFRK